MIQRQAVVDADHDADGAAGDQAVADDLERQEGRAALARENAVDEDPGGEVRAVEPQSDATPLERRRDEDLGLQPGRALIVHEARFGELLVPGAGDGDRMGLIDGGTRAPALGLANVVPIEADAPDP
jgi:hypothetical protein